MSQSPASKPCPTCRQEVDAQARYCPNCASEFGSLGPPPGRDVTQAFPLPADPQVSEDDRMFPVYCSACRRQTARAILSEGKCPACREAELRRTQAVVPPEPSVAVLQPGAAPNAQVQCPRCGAINPAAHRCCANCGCPLYAGQHAQPVVVIYQPPMPQVASSVGRPRARLHLILGMWFVTLGSIMAASEVTISMGLELVAVILAIVLVCGRSAADRVNGWIKLGLEAIAFTLGFAAAVLNATSGRIQEQPRFGNPPVEMRRDVLDSRGN